MAEHHRQAIDRSRRLAVLVAQERAEAIRQQIAAGLTCLSVVENLVEDGRAEEAKALLKKMHRLAEAVRRHCNEPDHVPAAEVAELRESLEHLETRIAAIDQILDA